MELILVAWEDYEDLTTFVWPLVVVVPELIFDGFIGSGPLLPLPAGGAYKTRLTPVLCVSSPLLEFQPIVDLILVIDLPDQLVQLDELFLF